MKIIYIFVFSVICTMISIAQNPFSKFGYNIPTVTSSKGEYEEFHDLSDIVEIGSVKYNVRTKEIVGFLDKHELEAEVSVLTTAMSIDPHCEKYYWISPYAYCLNNPIKLTDPTGMFVVGTDGKPVIFDKANGWSKNASSDVQKIGNAMMATPDGNKVFNDMQATDYGVTLNYKEGYHPSEKDKRGETKININAETNEIISAEVNLFDGALQDNVNLYHDIDNGVKTINNPSERADMLMKQVPTLTERIGQVGAHEVTHATDRNAMSHFVGSSKAEATAQNVEIRVIDQTNYINNRPLPVKVTLLNIIK